MLRTRHENVKFSKFQVRLISTLGRDAEVSAFISDRMVHRGRPSNPDAIIRALTLNGFVAPYASCDYTLGGNPAVKPQAKVKPAAKAKPSKGTKKQGNKVGKR